MRSVLSCYLVSGCGGRSSATTFRSRRADREPERCRRWPRSTRLSVEAVLVTWTTVWPEMVLRAESVARLMSKVLAAAFATTPETPCCCRLILSGVMAPLPAGTAAVGVNFNSLALMDGGRVEGERGAGQSAAETVTGFYAELASVESGDIDAEAGADFGVVHAAANAVLSVHGKRGAADGGDQAFNFSLRWRSPVLPFPWRTSCHRRG